jgi:hypothetical protein
MNRDVCEHFNPVDLPCDKCKGEAINRDDIIRMAREAGFKPHHSPEMWDITIASDEAIERFAALVAAVEREACAALLEANGMRCGEESLLRLILEANAAAIRARTP